MKQEQVSEISRVGDYVIEVCDPIGELPSATLQAKPRLADLRGKTICEVWNGRHWRAPETFPYIEELLMKRFPGIKIIPYTEFPPYAGPMPELTLHANPAEVASLVKEKGCDAVILGNGG